MLYSLHGKLPTPNMVGAVHVIFPPRKTTNTQHGRSGPCYIPSMENDQHPTWQERSMLYSLHGKLPTSNKVGSVHVIFPPWKTTNTEHGRSGPCYISSNTENGRSGPCYISSMENYQHPTWQERSMLYSLHGKLPTPNMVGAPSGPSLCLSSGSANNTNETANKLLLYLPCANSMQNWV